MSEPWFILGAGALGSLMSHCFAEAGVTHTLLHHRSGFRRLALQIDGRPVPQTACPLADLPPASVKRLLLTTKAGQIEQALATVAPQLDADPVVITTANGLGFPHRLPAPRDGLPLLRAVTTAGAFRAGDDRVTAVATGETLVGDGSAAPPLWFSDSLARVRGWQWRADIDTAVQRKFAINCAINGLTGVLNCRNGELLTGDRAGSELQDLCSELEPVLRELHLWSGPQTLVGVAEQVCRQTAANRSSLLQDLDAGRATELAFLNGELQRRATALGRPLPRNQALITAIAEREASSAR